MSHEASIYPILAEVAVHWRAKVCTLTKGSLSRVTSLDCHLTSEILFTLASRTNITLPKCQLAYSKLLLFKSFLICIFPSRFTFRVGWKRIAIYSGRKEHVIEKTRDPVTTFPDKVDTPDSKIARRLMRVQPVGGPNHLKSILDMTSWMSRKEERS
ncbi:hypothetical protein TNCV_822681 [Trichonephila clavipes]|nr:hypothetical protein TNCV_822681 [Trichonephila clavipes]